MIKFWAFIYRLTGWYSPFAKIYEYEYIKTQLKSIELRYNKNDNDMSLDNHIGLTIGIWQANHGFARPFDMKSYRRKLVRRLEKIKKEKK